MPPFERVRTRAQMMLEILELLVCASVLESIPNETGRRVVVQRLRSAVCFFYAYYEAAPLCLFANHLCMVDVVMRDFSWLTQVEFAPEPEAALLEMRNQCEYGG